MNFIANLSLLTGFQSYLGSWQGYALPLSESLPPGLVSPETSIAWSGCDSLDMGFNQSDLLFPIQCANINVPLDYTDDDNPQTIVLQLLRIQAVNQPSKGSVVINPGGPGESGCDYLALRASRFHAILGGNYDLVSFDPRGTGNTTPFSCVRRMPAAAPLNSVPKLYQELRDSLSYDTSVDFAMLYQKLNEYASRDGSAEIPRLYLRQLKDVLADKWELYETAANDCRDTEAKNGRYMSTAFTARDMFHIVDRLGEDGLLRYWGSSYGTILGITFAAMFPDRVGRMMLDATVNPHEYMAGTALEMLLDADKTFLAFAQECLAHPTQCPLARAVPPGEPAQRLIEAVNTMLLMLDLDAWGKGTHLYRDIKNDIIYRSLYWPTSWTDLGTKLIEYLAGNFSDFIADEIETASTEPAEDIFEYNKGSAAVFGTRCADAELRATNPDDLTPLLLQQAEVSSFADVNTATSLVCAAWGIEAAERYEGNFTAKTRHPILFVNGLYDPAAPAASAWNASRGFDGSAVLLHDGYGHGLGAHPNMCVGRAVRSYFVRGELPESGTVCEREVGPFDIDPRAWQNNPELLELG